jgi:nucleotide-binding universal stress UspA family protein
MGAAGVKRILVCLDGSPRAPGVLAAAIGLARGSEANLLLFRSVGLPPDVPQDFWKTSEEPLLVVLERRAKAYLDECAANVPKDLAVACEVAVGVPWQAVCDAQRRNEADLVVIGSHGYAGLDRLLGTTAAKIVNHAHCSVFVSRDPSQQ